MKTNVIIIDDSPKIEDDPITWELEDNFGKENVHFFLTPTEGLKYIKENLHKNMIVLLDIDFPENEKNGHEILSEISSMSQLIPVILWSGIDENKEAFSDFINNHAFGFLSKTATIEEILSKIKEAKISLSSSVDNAIEDWIILHKEDKNKPIYISSDGKAFSLNDILNQIRQQTDIGKEFTKKINKLTIDLLFRNKESLDD